MSSLPTPTRLGRGLVVPGIDTKPPLDNGNAALSYGGLHTPPQSAHESRRPSLQYGGISDAPYSASTYTHSQPVTPIHGLNHGLDFFAQRFSQSIDAQEATNTSLPGACSTSPVEHSFHTAFGPGATYHNSMVNDVQVYSNIDHTNSVDNLSVHPSSCSPTAETWGQSQVLPNAYASHNVGLGSTLFPSPHGMNVSANSPSSVFDHIGSSLHDFDYQYQSSAGSVCPTQGSYSETSQFQQPRIVVPSQVSPQDDYTTQQLSIYTTPSHSHDALNSSFSSGSIPFSGYEMVGPPSPQDAYFAYSEDEEYLMVKAEDLPSPVLGPSSRRLADFPVRPRRRPSRRTRKTGNRVTWCRHDINGCEVSCQGGQCFTEPWKLEVARNNKPYKCKFVKEDGRPCGSRFDRSEHLKRHEGSHSDERKYPCPLPGCGKSIGRPDNAGDHFKTHLRPKTAGKRNDHFDWPQVRDGIWEAYEDKKVAKKLLDGLRRWIDADMPDTSGSKRNVRAR
jgi:hypothetical protein